MIVNIETTKLHRALATIVRFAAKDADSRVCTVKFEGSAGGCDLTLIATNQHMLATYRIELEESLDEDVGSTYVAPSIQAAVAAIADYGVAKKTGAAADGSRKAVKAAGKAAAAAIGQRLLKEVDGLRSKAAKN